MLVHFCSFLVIIYKNILEYLLVTLDKVTEIPHYYHAIELLISKSILKLHLKMR